jgi:hypothetical protein
MSLPEAKRMDALPLRRISQNVSAVATPMSWTLKALLPGGARTQQIGVALLALQGES